MQSCRASCLPALLALWSWQLLFVAWSWGLHPAKSWEADRTGTGDWSLRQEKIKEQSLCLVGLQRQIK